jgi:hypothetical protein
MAVNLGIVLRIFVDTNIGTIQWLFWEDDRGGGEDKHTNNKNVDI